MPDYLAQYKQAMSEGNVDFAQTVITSAVQGAQTGVMSSEEITTFVEEVKKNPPEKQQGKSR